VKAESVTDIQFSKICPCCTFFHPIVNLKRYSLLSAGPLHWCQCTDELWITRDYLISPNQSKNKLEFKQIPSLIKKW